MKKIILTALLTSSLLTSAQMRIRLHFNDLYRENLKGNIKELTQKEYFSFNNEDGTPNLELRLTSNVKATNNYTLKFNTSGFLTEKETKSYGFRNEIQETKLLYEYDSINRIKKEYYTGNTYSAFTYIGDSLIKKVSYTASDYMSPQYLDYFQRGNKEISQEYIKGGTVTKIVRTYDKQGRTIRFDAYRDMRSIHYSYITTYVDNISKKIKSESSTFDREHPDKFLLKPVITTYQYDNNNNITKSTEVSSKETKIISYEYVYDENSNWIERKEINSNQKFKLVTKREITYYN